MTSTLHDLRFAFRSLRRRPALAGLAAGSLALGIGASVAMFSVVDSVLLRPLPHPDPDELVHIYIDNPEFRGHPTFGPFAERGTLSAPEFWWLEEKQDVLEGIGAFYRYGSATVTGPDGPTEQIELVIGSPTLLDVLDVQPTRGRRFGPEDDPATGARSVMLFESFWESRYGRDPDVIDATVVLDDEPWTVVGILPSSASVLTEDVDGWRLFSGSYVDGNWGNHALTGVIGRLADGVTVERADRELSRLLAEVPPEVHEHAGVNVFASHAELTRDVKPALTVLIAAALLLLAVGCGNVAALLVGAGIDREHEIAVRSSLGAGRGRLARQLLTESVALSAVGALGGVLVAWLIARGLLLLAPPDIPRIADAAIDPRALGFAIGIAALSGILSGLLPALHLSRPETASTVNSSRGATRGRSRLHSFVVVGELAMATVLLVSGALLARSFLALERIDPGFDVADLYEVRVAPPFQRIQEEGDARSAAIDAYFQEVVDAIEAIPVVQSVAVTSNVPLTGDRGNNIVTPEGWDAEAEGEELAAERRVVSDGYFETTGVAVVEGRPFEAYDNRSDAAPVVIISEGLAERAWPGESAVGRTLSFWGGDPVRIVGVAEDLRDEDLERATSYAFYVPARQVGSQTGALLVRSEVAPETLIPALRQAVWSVDPDIAIPTVASFEELVDQATSEHRYRARLMATFALLAAIFAMMGVYGVVSRSVTRRTREIGIRKALGARGANLRSSVLKQGLRLAIWGAFLGTVAAAGSAALLRELLFGVEPLDPVTLLGIAVVVGGLSVAAAVPPSLRATRVDPAIALRTE